MTPRQKDQLNALKVEVRKQFEQGNRMLLAMDHHYLKDKESVLDMDIHNMEKWVESVVLAREAYDRIRLAPFYARQRQQDALQRWLQQPVRQEAAQVALQRQNSDTNSSLGSTRQ